MSERVPGIRPRPTLWRTMDAASRAAFPATCTALLIAALAAPLHLPGQAFLQPAAALGCVFFWSLFRPASMTPPVVFMLGVMLDLLGVQPVGIGPLVLLCVHGLGVRWRVLAGQGFVLVWLAFVLVAAGAAALSWALNCLLTFRLLPMQAAIFQFGFTVGLYPALASVFIVAHRGLADPGRA